MGLSALAIAVAAPHLAELAHWRLCRRMGELAGAFTSAGLVMIR